MKKTVKTESARLHARTKLARRYNCVLGSNFLFDNLSLASKLSSVEREPCVQLESSLDIPKLATVPILTQLLSLSNTTKLILA
jgi:hypothetical protein